MIIENNISIPDADKEYIAERKTEFNDVCEQMFTSIEIGESIFVPQNKWADRIWGYLGCLPQYGYLFIYRSIKENGIEGVRFWRVNKDEYIIEEKRKGNRK